MHEDFQKLFGHGLLLKSVPEELEVFDEVDGVARREIISMGGLWQALHDCGSIEHGAHAAFAQVSLAVKMAKDILSMRVYADEPDELRGYRQRSMWWSDDMFRYSTAVRRAISVRSMVSRGIIQDDWRLFCPRTRVLLVGQIKDRYNFYVAHSSKPSHDVSDTHLHLVRELERSLIILHFVARELVDLKSWLISGRVMRDGELGETHACLQACVELLDQIFAPPLYDLAQVIRADVVIVASSIGQQDVASTTKYAQCALNTIEFAGLFPQLHELIALVDLIQETQDGLPVSVTDRSLMNFQLTGMLDIIERANASYDALDGSTMLSGVELASCELAKEGDLDVEALLQGLLEAIGSE